MDKPIHELRREYSRRGLSEQEAGDDPIALFRGWLAIAVQKVAGEPNAMSLATVDADGQPSVRIVLLKEVDERGFVFFTDYRSRKARELEQEPRASLCFWWVELERQVRVEGTTGRVTAAESDAYFASRPRLSQLGASASVQSAEIASRAELEKRLEAVKQAVGDDPVPRPTEWGGFRLRPTAIEFWQGREGRLHDRLLYTRAEDDAGWKRVRLSP